MKNSKVPWCDHTFNPWEGCRKKGPGCTNCFAEARNARFHGGRAPNWGKGAPRRRTSAKYWKQPLAWEARHAAFFAEHGRRQRVFCASLGDVFDEAVDPAWRVDLFALIAKTPHLTWLLLTKRIGNVKEMFAEAARQIGLLDAAGEPAWPLNVSLGATIVNQAEAKRDIPQLLAIPVAQRFLSLEPLLGPVDLRPYLRPWPGYCQVCGTALRPANATRCDACGCTDHDEGPPPARRFARLDWVIAGGETGAKARPMHPAWVRRLRDQCKAAGVPFFFKLWGEWIPRSRCYHVMESGQSASEVNPSCKVWPKVIRLTERGLDGRCLENVDGGDDCYMQRVGRGLSGHVLDGLEHQEHMQEAESVA